MSETDEQRGTASHISGRGRQREEKDKENEKLREK